MQVISTEKLPIKLWTNVIEDSAHAQVVNLANLPFAFKHIAIMPDVHAGYGMPIGGVLATKGVVIPNAVGVDIGCGMYACKTSLRAEEIDQEFLKRVMGGSKDFQGGIRAAVPTGFSHHSKKQDDVHMPRFDKVHLVIPAKRKSVVFEQYEKARKQIGTLGGGNHFIEIQADQDGAVWFMIHSGSRNIGKQVADHYNKLAKEMNEKYKAGVPKAWDLAFLPLDTEEGMAYLAEMEYCVEFAKANRALMAGGIRAAFLAAVGKDGDVEFHEPIDVAHNFAHYENHFGENVMVHRKGATRARKGELGIIPGSQGTSSFIVVGKGNPESFHSCSHGAGRKMSRTKARNELDLAAEIKHLDDMGVIHGIRHQKDLDEAPSAYKSIDLIMKFQQDLVDVDEQLRPLAVIKG